MNRGGLPPLQLMQGLFVCLCRVTSFRTSLTVDLHALTSCGCCTFGCTLLCCPCSSSWLNFLTNRSLTPPCYFSSMSACSQPVHSHFNQMESSATKLFQGMVALDNFVFESDRQGILQLHTAGATTSRCASNLHNAAQPPPPFAL